MNGTLALSAPFSKFYTVIGGPYSERIKSAVGVKMAHELKLPCDIDIPTFDFSVPTRVDLDSGLEKAVRAILAGDPLYVGCMAGRGRTGLFLAILAKAFGEKSPVEYVREHYYEHAVETDKQYNFVMAYPIPDKVQSLIFWAGVWSVFQFKKSLTNLEGVL